MPYSTNKSLPKNLQSLPDKAKTIFRKAFNNSLKQYKDETKARRVAWAAVKNVYKKNKQGKWVSKK